MKLKVRKNRGKLKVGGLRSIEGNLFKVRNIEFNKEMLMVNICEVMVIREINIIIIPAMTIGIYQNFERTYRNSILLLIIYYFATY